ncbi:hypothetical protein EW145_g5115, partial [Phellinidium pouzarii]
MRRLARQVLDSGSNEGSAAASQAVQTDPAGEIISTVGPTTGTSPSSTGSDITVQLTTPPTATSQTTSLTVQASGSSGTSGDSSVTNGVGSVASSGDVTDTSVSTSGSSESSTGVTPTGSSATTSTDSAAIVSDSSTSPASSSALPSLTSTSSSSQSASTTQSTESSSSSSTQTSTSPLTSSPSSSSSSSSTTTSTSTTSTSDSLSPVTSFSEIIETLNGQLTTSFTPVATLNSGSASSLSNGRQRAAIIAGSAVGGIVLIFACLTIAFCYCRRQKRAQDRAHRYVPAPRSQLLFGEDDFDPAPPRPSRGMGIFGSSRRNSDASPYRDAAPGASSSRDIATLGSLDSPEMRELDHEPPPRLLRPVTSKTGSYFQEAVWPPPAEGSLLRDPLMAASNVDLKSIVDDVMGPDTRPSLPGREADPSSSTGSVIPLARLRGGHGGGDSASLLSELDRASIDYAVPRTPWHEASGTMSSIGSSPDSPPWYSHNYQRESSVNSESAVLITHGDGFAHGSPQHSRDNSSGTTNVAWLPPGAASPYGRMTSPTSPLRVVTGQRPDSSMAGSAGTPPSSSHAGEHGAGGRGKSAATLTRA